MIKAQQEQELIQQTADQIVKDLRRALSRQLMAHFEASAYPGMENSHGIIILQKFFPQPEGKTGQRVADGAAQDITRRVLSIVDRFAQASNVADLTAGESFDIAAQAQRRAAEQMGLVQ